LVEEVIAVVLGVPSDVKDEFNFVEELELD
jgi:hypothetical protein